MRNSTIPTNAELVIFTGATDQHFAGIVKLNHLTAAPEEHFFIFIRSVRRMRLREVKEVSGGHTGVRDFVSVSVLSASPQSLLLSQSLPIATLPNPRER